MSGPVLTAGPIVLRRPVLEDVDEFLTAVDASRERHDGLVEPPASEASFAAYVDRVRRPQYGGFLVRTGDTDRLVGVVNINSIARGSIQSASIGYYRLTGAGERSSMTLAVERVVVHAFDDLRLHRVEANIQPHNARSIELVSSIGFRKEGYSPAFLRIGGVWRDHERWAIVAEHWTAPDASAVRRRPSWASRRETGRRP